MKVQNISNLTLLMLAQNDVARKTNRYYLCTHVFYVKVQVGNDQEEMAQSERNSHSKPRWEKTKMTGTSTKKTYS